MECSVEWPYDSFRRGQRELAEEVARAVSEGRLISVQAPTGFGKTASIVYGLLCAGAERVLYLVRTVNEVDPVIRELRRFGAQYTFLYSARRMCPLLRGAAQGMTSEEFWAACRLARLRGACPYYAALDEVGDARIAEAVRAGEGGSRSAVRRLAGLGVCPFFALRGLLDESEFIVATYPYAFRADIFASTLDPYDYSDFVIVVDEAHSLIKAHTMYERRLRRRDVEQALEESRRYVPSATVVLEALRDLESRFRLLERTVRGVERLDRAMAGRVLEELEALRGAAEEVLRRRLEEAILSGSSGREARSSIQRVASWAETLTIPGSFLFAEQTDQGLELVATPMDPAVAARPPLERAKAAVLLSGTLPPGDYVGELLGVQRDRAYVDVELMYGVKPPRAYTVVARDVTTRYRERGPDMMRALAVRVALIARLMPGAKLAVYPSYELMRDITGRLPAGLPMLVEDKGTSVEDVLEKLEDEPSLLINAVADGKLVEGVEYTRDGRSLVRTVIIVGVPFPQPDPYTRTYRELLSQRIPPKKADYYTYLYRAAIKVRQALGRATRSPEDRPAYFLLDYRYTRRDIREAIRIPINRVVSGLGGLQAAIQEARRRLGKD